MLLSRILVQYRGKRSGERTRTDGEGEKPNKSSNFTCNVSESYFVIVVQHTLARLSKPPMCQSHKITLENHF